MRSMNEGWICPRCGRVNAPFVVCCSCFNEKNLTNNSSKECEHYWIYTGKITSVGKEFRCRKCGKIKNFPVNSSISNQTSGISRGIQIIKSMEIH